jgi:hypothetical protein
MNRLADAFEYRLLPWSGKSLAEKTRAANLLAAFWLHWRLD